MKRKRNSRTVDPEKLNVKVPPSEQETVPPTIQDEVCYFDQLKDHHAVEVFKYLNIKEIATVVPQVCRRWCSLAASEVLWKNVTLEYTSGMLERDKKFFYECWRMAPKVFAVSFEIDYRDGFEFVQELSCKFPSQVINLHFIYDNLPPEAMFMLIEKYTNEIEVLRISDTNTAYVVSDVQRLWRLIVNLSKLRHLIIDGSGLLSYRYTFLKNSPCWSSLKIVDVKNCAYNDMDTVKNLIRVNPNWREVYLPRLSSSSIILSRAEVKELGKCLHLETVQVPFCKELSKLFNCFLLDSLVIVCVAETAKEVNFVVKAMSKSVVFPSLRAIKIIDCNALYPKLLRNILACCPQITLLNFVSCEVKCAVLLDVLHLGLNLETLLLNDIDADIVLAILQEVTNNNLLPKLKEVSVIDCYCSEKNGNCLNNALSQLCVKRGNVKTIAQNITCKCQPVQTIGYPTPRKGKPGSSRKIIHKQINSNNSSPAIKKKKKTNFVLG